MSNYLTKEEMKEQAIKNLQKLNIYKPYINDFKAKKQWVTMFEHYVGFWAWQYKDLDAKIKEIENEYDCMVYAVTHEYTPFGECYSLLLVSKCREDQEDNLYEMGDGKHYAFAYVWNKTDDWCSEFGTIGVQSVAGGIVRIA